MTTWLAWRAGALAAMVAAIIGLGVFMTRAPIPVDAGCRAESAAATPAASAGVTTHLAVLADADAFPRLVRTLSLQAPLTSDDAEDASVAALLQTSPAETKITPGVLPENRYREKLQSLLTSGSSGAFGWDLAGKILENVRELPTIAVGPTDVSDPGLATITIPLSSNQYLLNYPRGEGSVEYAAPPWEVSSDGRDLTLLINARLHPDTTWQVGVCVEGMQILSTNPQPTESDGSSRVRWTMSGPESAADVAKGLPSIMVRLRPEGATALRLWFFTGEGRFVPLAWAYLGPALLLLIGLALIPRRDDVSAALVQARVRLAATAFAVLRLAVAGCLALLAIAIPLSEAELVAPRVLLAIVGAAIVMIVLDTQWFRGERPRIGDLVAPALAFIVALAWIITYGRAEELSPAGGRDILLRVVLATGYAGLLATAVLVSRGYGGSADRQAATRLALVANFVAGLAVCTPVRPELAGLAPLWVTANFAVGFVLLLGALLPGEARKRFAGASPRTGWIVLAATAIVAIFIVAQWGWATYQAKNIWWRAPVEQDPVSHRGQIFTALTDASLGYPLAFLGPASALLPLLGLAGLMGVLGAVGRRARTPFWSGENGWVGSVVKLLFAVFVVGYGGEVFGFPLPLALMLALVLLRLTSTDRIVKAAAQVDEINEGADASGEPLIVSRRSELLDRAQDPTAQASLALPEGFTPGELALASGPASQWWNRGLAAIRLAIRIAWLPIAYFIYVLVVSRAQDLLAEPVPFAGIGFAAALASEIVFWFVAAFALGCLFPYLHGQNGLIKGAVLGGIFLGAQAGAALIEALLLSAPSDTLWLVRAVQLLLYLIVLGVLLDATTVEGEGFSWQYLLGRYRVEDAKAAVTYALTLIGLLVAIGEQIATGDAAKAITALAAGKGAIDSLQTAVLPILGGGS